MAAYAALVSLLNDIQQINNHPHLSSSLDKKRIEPLLEKAGLLLDFIEATKYGGGGGSKEAEDMDRQIASAAHAAEDVIESHIADQIHAGTNETSNECSLHLECGLIHLHVECGLIHLPIPSPSEGEDGFFYIQYCDLACWKADSSHFPVVEKLVLCELLELEGIPLEIGEIPTLKLIRVDTCSVSAVISGVKIKEDQLDNQGNDDLQIQVKMMHKDLDQLREKVEMEGLTMDSIQLETF